MRREGRVSVNPPPHGEESVRAKTCRFFFFLDVGNRRSI